MSEERDTTATGIRLDQPVIAQDELVHKQAAEVQPCRDPDREPPHQQVHAIAPLAPRVGPVSDAVLIKVMSACTMVAMNPPAK